MPSVITFDLFSALIDARSGGGAALDAAAARRSWPVSGYGRLRPLGRDQQGVAAHVPVVGLVP